MALAALFDDFPLHVCNGHHHRRNRPLTNILDYLENQMDQKVGHVFRKLPALLLELEDYESTGNGRKRKVGKALSPYEPKSKVQVTTKDNKFQVSLDTSTYQPDEITVKVVNDKLAVSAKHETKGGDVYEFHEMYRSFDLPEGVDPKTVSSRLCSNGQLIVEAPMKCLKNSGTERVIAVERANEQSSDKSETDAKNTDSESK